MIFGRIWRHGEHVEQSQYHCRNSAGHRPNAEGYRTTWRGQDGINRQDSRQATAQVVRCGSKKNCCCSACSMGEDSSSEEIVRQKSRQMGAFWNSIFDPCDFTEDSPVWAFRGDPS